MSFFQLPSFILKKHTIDQALKDLVNDITDNNSLKDSIEYSLFNGGKRIRPIIILMIQEALNCPYSIIDAALSIELFHTASLIADDLPMMDNDSMRRDKPSTHIKFGETTALLASYGLISKAFEKIYDCAKTIVHFDPSNEAYVEKISLMALKEASFAAGISGATLGQFFDLKPKEPCSVEKLIYLKTVTLFEVTFLFGWFFAGGSLDKIDQVKELSYHFGFAYQIADDLDDYNEDLQKEKIRNFAIAFGIKEAIDRFYFHLEKVKIKIQELNLSTKDFKALVFFIEKYGISSQKSLLGLEKATFETI